MPESTPITKNLEQVTPTSDVETQPVIIPDVVDELNPDNARRLSKGKKIAIAAGATVTGLLIAGGTVLGLSSNSTISTPKAGTETSAPANPNTNPTPGAATTPEATATASPEAQAPDISKYESMSVADFTALTNDEQVVYNVGKLIPGIDQFAKDYKAAYQEKTGKPYYDLPKGSIDNTAQEITTLVSYNGAYMLTLEGDEREKYIIGLLRDNNQSGAYQVIETVSNTLTATYNGREAAYYEVFSVGKATTMGEIKTDTNGDKYRSITEVEDDGSTNTYDAFYVKVGAYETWFRK